MVEGNQSRRWLLLTAGTGLAAAIAGCAGGDSEQTSTPSTTEPSTTDGRTPSTRTETTDRGTPAIADEPGPPGYKTNHWHGSLFFEVEGEFVDFDQPKYYLDTVEDETPETILFHFHEKAHGTWEWSNELQQITLERGLNLLPDIAYARRGGDHVVQYEGRTYDGGASGTEVTVHRGTEPIDPTTYTVQHGDAFWVRAITQDAARDVRPAHDDADLGTLFFDVNNRRFDFADSTPEDVGTDAFHFHDDGHPYLWYVESDGVTLETALNILPGVTYGQDADGHVIDYVSGDSYSGTYRQGNSTDEIVVRQRTANVDPTAYELQAGDAIWVYVHTARAPDNEH